jgi:hypothetical protein
MFRKSTILSLAAAATLGVLAISTTSASAFHFGGGGARAGGVHFSAARVATPHFAFRRNFQIRRLSFVKVFPPHHNHWHWWWWHHHHRLIWGAPVIGGVSYASAPSYSRAPTYSTCNCLTKTYTQEGAVVFKDVCTNEMAMNPPAEAAPQAPTLGENQPQMPIQQGYLQPQMQPTQ